MGVRKALPNDSNTRRSFAFAWQYFATKRPFNMPQCGIFTQAYHFLDGIRALQGNLEKQDCFTIQGVKTV